MNPVNKQWPSKHIRGVHPYPACGHLLEKESSGRWGVLSPARRDSRGRLGTAVPTPSLAKSQAPKGRHAIAWGGNPGSDGPKKHKPRRGGTIQYTVPRRFQERSKAVQRTALQDADAKTAHSIFTADQKTSYGVHPHPACGHLLPDGEGIKQAALGQATRTLRYPLPAGEGRGEGERVIITSHVFHRQTLYN